MRYPPQHGRTGIGLSGELSFGFAPIPQLLIGAGLKSFMFSNTSVDSVASEPSFVGPSRHSSAKYTGYGLLVLTYPTSGGFNAGVAFGTLSSYACCSYADDAPSGFVLAPQLGFDDWIGDDWLLGVQVSASFSRLSGPGSYVGGAEVSNTTLTSLALVLTYD